MLNYAFILLAIFYGILVNLIFLSFYIFKHLKKYREKNKTILNFAIKG